MARGAGIDPQWLHGNDTAPVGHEISRGAFQLGRRITRQDLRRVVELACSLLAPPGRVLLTARLLCFRVDDVEARNPVGVLCYRLEVDAKVTEGRNDHPK